MADASTSNAKALIRLTLVRLSSAPNALKHLLTKRKIWARRVFKVNRNPIPAQSIWDAIKKSRRKLKQPRGIIWRCWRRAAKQEPFVARAQRFMIGHYGSRPFFKKSLICFTMAHAIITIVWGKNNFISINKDITVLVKHGLQETLNLEKKIYVWYIEVLLSKVSVSFMIHRLVFLLCVLLLYG